MDKTTYIAIIEEEVWCSKHKTEDAAVAALKDAQRRLGLEGGHVTKYVKSGLHRSRMQVYPTTGEMYSN